MQKVKHRILSTGPLPEAAIEEAAAQNIIVDVRPFIETRPKIDDAIAEQIQQLFQKPITVVFTSSNAITAVAQFFRKPIHWKIYCVGVTTAKLSEQLFQIPILGSADNAATLADIILKAGTSEIFFFCGNIRRDELPQKLRSANILVNEIVVYETVPTPHVISEHYDAVLFFSPSAVQSFFLTNRIHSETKLFAIGETTAEAIRRHTKSPVIVAQNPSKEFLVKQVATYFNTEKEKTNE